MREPLLFSLKKKHSIFWKLHYCNTHLPQSWTPHKFCDRLLTYYLPRFSKHYVSQFCILQVQFLCSYTSIRNFSPTIFSENLKDEEESVFLDHALTDSILAQSGDEIDEISLLSKKDEKNERNFFLSEFNKYVLHKHIARFPAKQCRPICEQV